MSAIIRTDQTLYYLLGEQASGCYLDTDNIEETIQQAKDYGYDLEVAVITDGMSFDAALNMIDGFFGYCEITEADYNIIKEQMPELFSE